MRKEQGRWILALALIYLALHFIQHHQIGPEVLRFYGKDLILVPMLLGGIAMAGQFFNKAIPMGTKEVIIAVVYCGLVFELVIPQVVENAHFDFIDLICYSIGAAIWHFKFIEKRQKIVDKSMG